MGVHRTLCPYRRKFAAGSDFVTSVLTASGADSGLGTPPGFGFGSATSAYLWLMGHRIMQEAVHLDDFTRGWAWGLTAWGMLGE